MTLWVDENLSPALSRCLDLLEWKINVKYIPDVFEKGIKDKEWIPKIKGDFVLTGDYKMRLKNYERPILETNEIGIFFIKFPSKKGLSLYDQIRLVIKHWPKIVHIMTKESRPFMYKLTNKTIEKI